ncbi:hypothetical protein [Catenulispora sp. GAS73]|uniref:hypothetical protein n=1 Tax=Catenulispora sp. GAS73 TaxID=3156269 RepID=UPI0035167D98
MQEVTLRPAMSLTPLKAIIVVWDLAFIAFPIWLASIHFSAALVAMFAVLSLALIAAGTFFGWLGLQMRVEVTPDAVRVYYFKPAPIIIPRDGIAEVRVGPMSRGGNYSPCVVMIDGRARVVLPLTMRTQAQAQQQVERLQEALSEVAPAAL